MTEPVGWLRAVVIDAREADRLATFWTAVLGVEVADRQEGWVQLAPDEGGVYLAFEGRDPEDADATTRDGGLPPPRPDIEVTDLDGAQARVEALGGRLIKVIEAMPGESHRRMADPEGNEFTLVLPLPPALQR